MSLVLKMPEVGMTESDLKLFLSIKLFQEGIISLGKASEIAGYSERAFFEILRRKGIAPIHYEEKDLIEESTGAKSRRHR